MAQFMLLLEGKPGSLASLSPTEIQALIEKYHAWRSKLEAADKMVYGRKLMDEGGKVLSKQGNRLATVDGPYVETKEVVGGFFVIRAADYDEALQLASDCPHLPFGPIGIRQIDFMGNPEA